MSLDDLTQRERDVLKELSEAATTEMIAEILDISPHTVRSHLRSIRRKLGLAKARSQGRNTRIQMATLYLRNQADGDAARPG